MQDWLVLAVIASCCRDEMLVGSSSKGFNYLAERLCSLTEKRGASDDV